MNANNSPSPDIDIKTYVHVIGQLNSVSISRQYHVDLFFDGHTFYCKFRTSAKLAEGNKKVFVYLCLDASHLSSLERLNDAVPQDVVNAFIERGRCKSSTEIESLQFRLREHVPLVCPSSGLHKRSSRDVDPLLRLGQCDTFTVYMPSQCMKQSSTEKLSAALCRDDSASLQSGTDNLKTLYAGTGGRRITSVDELWSFHGPEAPPPYDLSTSPGASTKRRLEYSEPPLGPLKRRLKVEKGFEGLEEGFKESVDEKATLTRTKHAFVPGPGHVIEPDLCSVFPKTWQEAIAAQSAQLAALSAQVTIMREELQRYHSVRMVDVSVQTEPVHRPGHSTCIDPQQSPPRSPVSEPPKSPSSHSQASTVENTVEDRLTILEDSLIGEQKQRRLLEDSINQKMEANYSRLDQMIEHESYGLQESIGELETRFEGLEEELKESMEEKAMLTRINLEELLENKMEDVEDVVKNDIRIALENADYKFKVDLCWAGNDV